MKTICMILILLAGCTTPTFYQKQQVAEELAKNGQIISVLMMGVEQDYEQKREYYQLLTATAPPREKFILQELGWWLHDMEEKKDAFMQKSHEIKASNDALLAEVIQKEEEALVEGDPVYEKVENFAANAEKTIEDSLKELKVYHESSQAFANFSVLTGNMLPQAEEAQD
jgi:hypothetical protein